MRLGCGFCDSIAVKLKPDWPEVRKHAQVQSFEDFTEKISACTSITDVKISPDGGVSWGTWNVDLRPDPSLSYEKKVYRFHIQTCESSCKYHHKVTSWELSDADHV
jgi:hypothetical protein